MRIDAIEGAAYGTEKGKKGIKLVSYQRLPPPSTYSKIEDILDGGSLMPDKISLVRCKPDGMLSSTAKPRRETSSLSII